MGVAASWSAAVAAAWDLAVRALAPKAGRALVFVPREEAPPADISYRALVREGIKGNAAVFAAVSLLGRAFSEPPFLVFRRGPSGQSVVDLEHPARALLVQPNPYMGESELWERVILYAAVGGSCYIWKERALSGAVVGLWPISDGQMRPGVSPGGWLSGYVYDPGNGREVLVPVEDVIHFRWAPDPEFPVRGLSPLVALAREIDTDNESGRYARTVLINDATPRTLVTVPASGSTAAARREMRGELTREHGGERRGGIAVLPGDVHVSRLGLALDELNMDALRDVPETRIASAFGVPIVLLGLRAGIERAVQGAPSEMRQIFVESTLIPLWRRLGSALSRGLAGEFAGPGSAPGWWVAADLNSVRALAEDNNRRWARVTAAVKAGYVSNDLALELLGLGRGGPGDSSA